MSLFLTSPLKGFTALTQKSLNVSVNSGMGSYITDILIGVFTVLTPDWFSGMIFQMCVQFTAPFESLTTLWMETNKSLVRNMFFSDGLTVLSGSENLCCKMNTRTCTRSEYICVFQRHSELRKVFYSHCRLRGGVCP